MKVNKEELFTTTAALGIVKDAVKIALPGYNPEICDQIVFNRVLASIEARRKTKKGADK